MANVFGPGCYNVSRYGSARKGDDSTRVLEELPLADLKISRQIGAAVNDPRIRTWVLECFSDFASLPKIHSIHDLCLTKTKIKSLQMVNTHPGEQSRR